MPINNSHSNRLLVNELSKGNKKAFNKLFELYWKPLFIRAKSIVLDENLAQDIVQKIWIDIWQKREKRSIENFEAYVFKSVNNACYKHFKDTKFNKVHLKVIESLKIAVSPQIEKQFDLEQTQNYIEESLKNLSPRCRLIFKLSRMEDASNEEIAAQLGISKRSVQNQISIALKSVRQYLAVSPSLIPIFLITLQ